MTQQQVADLVGISLRSYKSYENDEEKRDTIKYKYIKEQLLKINYIDEEHGVLELDDIIRKCSKVLEQYDVKFCYLFGSYAKGKATPVSDVDLLISANVKGLKFYGLVEEYMTGREIVNLINKLQEKGMKKVRFGLFFSFDDIFLFLFTIRSPIYCTPYPIYFNYQQENNVFDKRRKQDERICD